MIIKHHDILLLLSHARANYNHISNSHRLPGMDRALSEGERLGVAYLQAALTLLGGLDIETSMVTVDLQEVHNESIHD